jgi:hypothetical protein
MLKNADGTPYKALGCLQHFNPESPIHDLFNNWDQQIIGMGGAPIFYHEVFIQRSTVDTLYWEDRGKLFNPNGVQLWATYEPVTQQNFQSTFGIDSPDDIQFELNYRAVLNTIGHPPKVGSRIFTPHKREHWLIVQRKLGEYKMWGEIRLQLVCERFTQDINDPPIEQKQPDFTIN